MHRYRRDAFLPFMDELLLTGSTSIRWDQFYLWTRSERITKGTWRLVHEIWTAHCEANGYGKLPLSTIQRKYVLTLRRSRFETEKEENLQDLI